MDKFTSKYGADRDITAAQKLAETVIERQALVNKVKLPNKFWELREWKPKFLLQLRLANSLLKMYSYECLNNVLMSKAALKTFSLKAPWLDALFEGEQKRLDSLKALKEETLKDVVQEKAVVAEKFGQKKKESIFDKLEGI